MATETRTFVIAEAGVNHNGAMDMALRLVDAAADAGADAVKVQSFRADRLVTRAARKAEYQERTTGSGGGQFEMLKALELSPSDHEALIARCRNRGIEFLSTPFDAESLRMLVELGLGTVKVSSGDLTDAPFLLEIARTGKRIILSTGMGTLAEVEAALGVVAFGATAEPAARAGPEAFRRAFASDAGQAALGDRVALLHCTTEYPAPFAEVNLRAMDTLAAAFGLPVGYSDHTPGEHVSIAAVARGARIVEKHFTLDRGLPGPDHKASLEPAELREMVRAIRDVESALGDGVKRPSPSEWKNREAARKSLVAAKSLEPGEPMELACKRPGSGVSPFEYWNRRGAAAPRAYEADEAIDG
jgi:N-acetylneuraminate synthase